MSFGVLSYMRKKFFREGKDPFECLSKDLRQIHKTK